MKKKEKKEKNKIMSITTTQKIKEILGERKNFIKPSSDELDDLRKSTEEIIKIIDLGIKKRKISASVFVGGSSAKGTLIKKEKYDVDLFVRFDKKYSSGKISEMLGKIAPKDSERVHGSRDYFRIKKEIAEFEIIPVLKIKKPEEAENITDLSYFHVNYVKNKIKKDKNLADDIMLSKAFIHFAGCYGAESYINGFSGYAVELLVVYYKSFLKFISAIADSDIKKQKIILDPAKFYKNKEQILQEINEAKLLSPIVLIDPTYKERNALAALSEQTFFKFQEVCRKFLKNPSEKFFMAEDKEANFEKKHKNIISVEIFTDRQAGDIAGTKLKKFAGSFIREISRFFDVKDSLFVYNEKLNKGRILLSLGNKKDIIFPGPPVKMAEPFRKFKKEHKNIKIKAGKAYAVEKNNLEFDGFLKKFQNEKSKMISDMNISRIILV